MLPIADELKRAKRLYRKDAMMAVASSTARGIVGRVVPEMRGSVPTVTIYRGDDGTTLNQMWDPGIGTPTVTGVAANADAFLYVDVSGATLTVGHGYLFYAGLDTDL